jgi:ferredoxin
VNTKRLLSGKDLGDLASDLIDAGFDVIAPVLCLQGSGDRVEYRKVRHPGDIFLAGGIPSRPLKEVVFPPSESLFKWKQNKASVVVEAAPTDFRETVILGARPCDAAALDIVDKVMDWGYRDELWFGRRNAVTVLSLACSKCDDACFCTSVGLSPSATRGADGLMGRYEDGYLVEAFTPKGRKLLERFGGRFPETDEKPESSDIEGKMCSRLSAGPETIQRWLERHFDHPYWHEVALRCHGCGACAFVCPACHCFDIVDEPEGIDRGDRRRNWDACQPAVFTLHASGHNPRKDQAARFRQRIMHKFQIYPARFGDILCTGCGRCIRTCAAGMDLIGILSDIGRMAEEEGAL